MSGSQSLTLKEISALRIRLQQSKNFRELALFNLAIDSKLRTRDLVRLRVCDIAQGGRVANRAIVTQQKTNQRVRFEITSESRESLASWIALAGLMPSDYLFPSRISASQPNQVRSSESLATESAHSTDRVPTIRLQQVSRRYGSGESEVIALDNIDFTVQKGEFVALMGPSGAGKSTCLNMLGCLDRPTNGHYFFQGVDVAYLSGEKRALLRRHFIGFVFQGFNLLNRTTALENVELPLIYRRVPAKERHRRAHEAMEKVGLSGREKHTPGELSGGQQQRVAIARAIVTDPALMLADEPTGNLDSAKSQEILRLLTHLNQEQGLTIVMVTHEAEIAAFAQRKVHFLDGRIDSDTTSREQSE